MKKDGPNKGRPFWCCAKGQKEEGGCNFFELQEPSSSSSAARKWGYGQLRSVQHPLPKPHQRTVLKHLLRAEMFEHYLAKEFPASKR